MAYGDERTCAVYYDGVHVADIVGSANVLFDGDKSERRGLRGLAYIIRPLSASTPAMRRSWAMPAGESFYTYTMARNAIRAVAKGQHMESVLDEGFAPLKADSKAGPGQQAILGPTVRGGYWVYTDVPTNMSRVHRESCRYYRDRKSTRQPDNYWHGPYESKEQAKSSPKNFGPVLECGACNP